MNVYLDIDGVILTNGKPAKHVKDFLKYFTTRHPTYWLTTHCKGDEKQALSYLSNFLKGETFELIKKIKPTSWSYSKTEAIDFNSPFVWFDDFIFEFEKKELIKHNVLNSWIRVDLSRNVNHLKDILGIFQDLKKK